MKNKRNKNLKEGHITMLATHYSGITLIALVVTIVVLLILAGITINMVFSDNGIIKTAQDAGDRMNKAKIIETIKTEVVGKQATNLGILTEDELQEILEKYGTLLDEGEESILDKTLTTTEGEYEIKVSEIWSGKLKKIIKFYVGEDEFKALDGMTWETFIKSDYNPKLKEWALDKGISLVRQGNVELPISEWDGKNEEGAAYRLFSIYNETFVFLPACSGDRLYMEVSSLGALPLNSQFPSNGQILNTADPACVFGGTCILSSKVGDVMVAKDVVDGTNIAYFDFETNTIEIGTVESIYIHKNATNFVRYVFEDGSYLEATDYHPIYTKEGWKSLTNIKNYETPKVGDEVKTKDEWKKIEKIETWQGLEDCYDFKVVSEDGKAVNNYFANNTLVQSSFAIFKQLNN